MIPVHLCWVGACFVVKKKHEVRTKVLVGNVRIVSRRTCSACLPIKLDWPDTRSMGGFRHRRRGVRDPPMMANHDGAAKHKYFERQDHVMRVPPETCTRYTLVEDALGCFLLWVLGSCIHSQKTNRPDEKLIPNRHPISIIIIFSMGFLNRRRVPCA